MWKNRPWQFQWFGRVALAGAVLQVFAAYLGRPFNLVVFFMRLGAYVYATFLYNYLRSLAIQARVQ